MDYRLTRSKRKTVSLSINQSLEVVVKAPLHMPVKAIDAFVSSHQAWIEKHRILVEKQQEQKALHALSTEDILRLKSLAKEIIPQKVAYYSGIMGVFPTGIKITSAETRWGSCSGRNSLCFSYRLMLLPDRLIDHVVVHELAHIRVKNHSPKFYAEIEAYQADYRERIQELKRLSRCQ